MNKERIIGFNFGIIGGYSFNHKEFNIIPSIFIIRTGSLNTKELNIKWLRFGLKIVLDKRKYFIQ